MVILQDAGRRPVESCGPEADLTEQHETETTAPDHRHGMNSRHSNNTPSLTTSNRRVF